MTTKEMRSFSVFFSEAMQCRYCAVGREGELLNPEKGKCVLQNKGVIRGEAARTGLQQGF